MVFNKIKIKINKQLLFKVLRCTAMYGNVRYRTMQYNAVQYNAMDSASKRNAGKKRICLRVFLPWQCNEFFLTNNCLLWRFYCPKLLSCVFRVARCVCVEYESCSLFPCYSFILCFVSLQTVISVPVAGTTRTTDRVPLPASKVRVKSTPESGISSDDSVTSSTRTPTS